MKTKSILNPISIGLILTYLVMLVIGAGAIYIGAAERNIWAVVLGVVFSFAPVLAVFAGQKTLGNDPLVRGLPSIWGIRIESFTFSGKILIAPFFPFFINVVEIEMKQEEVKGIKIENVVSSDGVVMDGDISFGIIADECFLKSFVDMGRMVGSDTRLAASAMPILQNICNPMGWRDIRRNTADGVGTIAGAVQTMINNNEKDNPNFPIVVQWVKLKLNPPKEIIEAEQAAELEKLQVDSENRDYGTIEAAAQRRWKMFQDDTSCPDNKKPTLRECIEMIHQERLIRQNQAFAVLSDGGVTINEFKHGGTGGGKSK